MKRGMSTCISLPGGLLAQSIEEGVWVEEFWQVQRFWEENLLLSSLNPILEGKTSALNELRGIGS